MGLTDCPPRGPGFNSQQPAVEYQGISPWLITLRQPVLRQKMAQSPLDQWHHTTCRHRGRRPTSNHGQTMGGKNDLKGTVFLNTRSYTSNWYRGFRRVIAHFLIDLNTRFRSCDHS